MDPDEALKELREALVKWRSKRLEASKSAPYADGREAALEVAESIADHAEDLDGWLSKGGFLPQDWSQKR